MMNVLIERKNITYPIGRVGRGSVVQRLETLVRPAVLLVVAVFQQAAFGAPGRADRDHVGLLICLGVLHLWQVSTRRVSCWIGSY